MRQTTEHRSYIGSRAVLSCHGPSEAYSGRCGRPGFTLIEVVVACAILLILLVGLLGFYGTSLATSRRTQVTEVAQNLAELQVEDIRSLSVYLLKSLVKPGREQTGTDALAHPVYVDVPASAGFMNNNYPLDQAVSSTTGNTVYDSGWQASDFILSGIESVVVGGTTYTSSEPSAPLVLPPSITLSVDPSNALRYELTVMKETFPHLEKCIVVRLVRDGQRDAVTKAETAVPADGYYWPSSGESSFVFSYSVTVRWAESAQDQANGRYRSLELSGLTGQGIVGN